MKLILAWGKKWQVSMTPDKTQMMEVTRRQNRQQLHLPDIKLNNNILIEQSSINILGVEVDNKLSFTGHVKNIAQNCARKLACLRRVSRYLDANGSWYCTIPRCTQ